MGADTEIPAEAGDWIAEAPWSSRSLLLVWTGDSTDVPAQAFRVGDKRDLLTRDDGDLLAVWPGRWSTSTRYLSLADRAAVLERL